MSFGRVLNVENVDLRVDLFEVSRVVSVLLNEDGASVVVQRFPEESLVRESEDEEVARRSAAAEDVGD